MRLARVLFVFLVSAALPATAAPPAENANGSTASAAERALAPLQSLVAPLASATAEIDRLRRELKKAATEDAKQEIQSRIDAERDRVRQLRGNLRDMLGGAEAAAYEGQETPADTGLQKQIGELIQPLLGELREATSGPRELDGLRKSLETWTERKQQADTVADRIAGFSKLAKGPTLVAELESARRLWEGRQAEATGQIAVIRSRIEDRERQQKPLWETLSDLSSKFFRTRGLNLLLAAIAAVSGFILTRRIYALLRRHSPVHRRAKASLTSRISDILAMALAILAALLGIVLVFYIRGDWLLLTVVAIMLIGAVWAGKTSLPPYIDQIRMLLNLGSVREGERVIHLGLPWRVDSLGFLTTFSNPKLQGGTLRVPIRDVMPMTSREPDPTEPWFPTDEDDWVLLADGTYGKTITQTPEQVVVLRLGGSLKTYPTADFLAQSPENLSRGFRVSCVFGIDYRHQPQAADEIPETLQRALGDALIADHGRDAVRSVKVEFDEAAASSLNYRVLADFDGALASRYQHLHRRIQTLCLEACNARGWVIPFTQITVHQA